MSQPNQADQFLIQEIRDGNEDGWRQVVDRYQGRLWAFARRQLHDDQAAEDIVQETFIGLLQGLDRLELWTSLETCLFTILRRRLVDSFRRSGRAGPLRMCTPQSSGQLDDSDATDGVDQWVDRRGVTASKYSEQCEQRTIQERALWHALSHSIEHLRKVTKFRELQVFEMIFYAQMRNKEIAELVGIEQQQVGLLKHRFIKRLAEEIQRDTGSSDLLVDDCVLIRLWEEHRPSCPKRSTLGKKILGLLSPAWCEYIDFHVGTLGCQACQANLQDLKDDDPQTATKKICDRILQSSIGFIRK